MGFALTQIDATRFAVAFNGEVTEWPNVRGWIRGSEATDNAKPIAYSNLTLLGHTRFAVAFNGEVTEWPNVRDWKSRVPQKGTEGSNPSLSAIFDLVVRQRFTDAQEPREEKVRTQVRTRSLSSLLFYRILQGRM